MEIPCNYHVCRGCPFRWHAHLDNADVCLKNSKIRMIDRSLKFGLIVPPNCDRLMEYEVLYQYAEKADTTEEKAT